MGVTSPILPHRMRNGPLHACGVGMTDHREHQIVYVKADLLKVAAREPGRGDLMTMTERLLKIDMCGGR